MQQFGSSEGETGGEERPSKILPDPAEDVLVIKTLSAECIDCGAKRSLVVSDVCGLDFAYLKRTSARWTMEDLKLRIRSKRNYVPSASQALKGPISSLIFIRVCA